MAKLLCIIISVLSISRDKSNSNLLKKKNGGGKVGRQIIGRLGLTYPH